MSKQIREVRVVDLITYSIIPVPIILILWLLLVPLFKSFISIHWIIYIVASILTYILVRRFAIGVVLIYKVTAPLEVRSACRFTPTCSTYMIMAINKYGLIIGIIKGINRLSRCKPPNGGVDYP